jgi:hypothetical protein
LRAELAEKRELLAKLRQELEISRESWKLVKKKTADSEREWRALRDEFAERCGFLIIGILFFKCIFSFVLFYICSF